MKRRKLTCIILTLLLVFSTNISQVFSMTIDNYVPDRDFEQVQEPVIHLERQERENKSSNEEIIIIPELEHRDANKEPEANLFSENIMMTVNGLEGTEQVATISGTISLPEGMTAPDGGLELSIDAYDENDRWVSSTPILTMPAQGKSIPFELTVPINGVNSKYRLGYDIYGTQGLKIIERGYYSTSGTKYFIDYAELLDVNNDDISNINIQILESGIISGTISLPEGMEAPEGGLEVYVFWMVKVSENSWRGVGEDLIIAAGDNSVDYTLSVPKDQTGSAYKIRCDISDPRGLRIMPRVYYSSAGTTINLNKADLVDISTGDKSDINIDVLEANYISGTISLPAGMEAPTGGLGISISAFDENNYHVNSQYINIQEGKNAAAYTIAVPAIVAGSECKIGYYISDPRGLRIIPQAYYSSAGTTLKINEADLVDISTGDKSDINIDVLEANFISGTIYLPNGMEAPAGGLQLWIDAYDENDNYVTSQFITIQEGTNAATYTIALPTEGSGLRFKIGYDIYYPSDLRVLRQAYYSSTGTIIDLDEADLVDISTGDKSNIDLTILEANLISGTIYLPDGMEAPAGGLRLWIEAYDENDNYITYQYITIQEGENAAPYTIAVPTEGAGLRFKIGYWISEGSGLNVITEGYYTAEGTTPDFSEGEYVSVSNGDAYGIDLYILEMSIMAGDCNKDGRVDIDDLVILSLTYNLTEENPNFDDRADFDGNGVVDQEDLEVLISNYGK